MKDGEHTCGWNPWHGCHKISEGCRHCYVYRMDQNYGKEPGVVMRNQEFDLPLRKNRKGEYKIPPGTLVYTCFTSDFFVEESDPWRPQAWAMMKKRSDLHFLLITKRIHRFYEGLPDDWGEGYPNVTVCCTVESQRQADFRLPLYEKAPIRHKIIVCEPLLEPIQLTPYLTFPVEEVVVGGESGNEARECHFDWVLDLRRQCVERNIPFTFRQTGAHFVKDGRHYRILRKDQHSQAKKAGIDFL